MLEPMLPSLTSSGAEMSFMSSYQPLSVHTSSKEPVPLGVTFDPRRGLWKARIHYRGQERYIGRFKSSEEAALAYDQAARYINSSLHSAGAAADTTCGAGGRDQPDQVSRKRQRMLNFPGRTLDNPKVTSRLLKIFSCTHEDSSTNNDLSAYAAEGTPASSEDAATVAAPTAAADASSPDLFAAAAQPEKSSAGSTASVQGAGKDIMARFLLCVTFPHPLKGTVETRHRVAARKVRRRPSQVRMAAASSAATAVVGAAAPAAFPKTADVQSGAFYEAYDAFAP